jgi:hypothetical protein
MTDKNIFQAEKRDSDIVLSNTGRATRLYASLADAKEGARKVLKQKAEGTGTMGITVQGHETLTETLTGLTQITTEIRHGTGLILIEAKSGERIVFPFSENDVLSLLSEGGETSADHTSLSDDALGNTVLGEDATETPNQPLQQTDAVQLPDRSKTSGNPAEEADRILREMDNQA